MYILNTFKYISNILHFKMRLNSLKTKDSTKASKKRKKVEVERKKRK